jgi:hypothetical protein
MSNQKFLKDLIVKLQRIIVLSEKDGSNSKQEIKRIAIEMMDPLKKAAEDEKLLNLYFKYVFGDIKDVNEELTIRSQIARIVFRDISVKS